MSHSLLGGIHPLAEDVIHETTFHKATSTKREGNQRILYTDEYSLAISEPLLLHYLFTKDPSLANMHSEHTCWTRGSKTVVNNYETPQAHRLVLVGP